MKPAEITELWCIIDAAGNLVGADIDDEASPLLVWPTSAAAEMWLLSALERGELVLGDPIQIVGESTWKPT